MQVKSTVDQKEIHKFTKLAKNWWNERSKDFGMLHKMNPIRMEYILKQIGTLHDVKTLDVGCGGGVLTIPLARLGANVTGLDPATESIEIATLKAKEEGLKINFVNSTIEEFKGNKFDLILLMEIVEHVPNLSEFLKCVSRKVKKGGLLIISTINNTIYSKIFAKFFAENILGLIPKGTHETENFVNPEYILSILDDFFEVDRTGFGFNIIKSNFYFTKNMEINYFLTLKKY